MKTSHQKVFHPRPVARCSKCEAITTDLELLNTTCGNRVSTGFCRGILRCALRPSDWIECPDCESDPGPSRHCATCTSSGWIFAGKPVIGSAGKSVRAELMFHAEGLRGLAGRTRALAQTVSDEDQKRLLRQAFELDQYARRLEIEALIPNTTLRN